MADRVLKEAPQEYAKDLIPDYRTWLCIYSLREDDWTRCSAFGCRRFVVDVNYTSSLHRPNVSLKKNVIESIVPEGIRTKDGDIIPLDVIVYATGFQAVS